MTREMKIAVLAWGSLCWDRGDLQVVGDFQPDGPVLPVEFCRISGSRGTPRARRLTLVIDELFGTLCRTYSTRSAFNDLDGALENLWRRETRSRRRTPPNLGGLGIVSYIDLRTGEVGARAKGYGSATSVIKTWAAVQAYDAVVWTTLGNNFQLEADAPFSVNEATQFLAGLSGAERAEAFKYIRKAPSEIQTPVRTAFNERWPNSLQ